jgi:hypothetical protein
MRFMSGACMLGFRNSTFIFLGELRALAFDFPDLGDPQRGDQAGALFDHLINNTVRVACVVCSLNKHGVYFRLSQHAGPSL